MRIRVFGVDYTVEHKETVESQGDMCYGVHRFGERIIKVNSEHVDARQHLERVLGPEAWLEALGEER